MENRPAIDEAIESKIQNWRLARMSQVDRSILRLGTSELLLTSVEVRIVISKAVDLAKMFGTEESGAFVNGVLDRVATLRPPATP